MVGQNGNQTRERENLRVKVMDLNRKVEEKGWSAAEFVITPKGAMQNFEHNDVKLNKPPKQQKECMGMQGYAWVRIGQTQAMHPASEICNALSVTNQRSKWQ